MIRLSEPQIVTDMSTDGRWHLAANPIPAKPRGGRWYRFECGVERRATVRGCDVLLVAPWRWSMDDPAGGVDCQRCLRTHRFRRDAEMRRAAALQRAELLGT